MSVLYYKYRDDTEFTIDWYYVRLAQIEIEYHLLDNIASRAEFSDYGFEISVTNGLEEFAEIILLRFKYTNNDSDIEEVINSLVRDYKMEINWYDREEYV